MEEVQMTAAGQQASLPHWNPAMRTGGERRMAPPKWGYIEVVNKDKEGEIIASDRAECCRGDLPAPFVVAACCC